MSDHTEPKEWYAATIAHWEALLAGAEANREDLPALEPYRAQLEAAVKDTKDARAQRLSQEAAARQATQELHAALRLGGDLASRFESGVRFLYGSRSPKLEEFGMKPLGRRKQASQGCNARVPPGSHSNR